MIMVGENDGSVGLFRSDTGQEVARFVSFTDGEWVVITPEGYYNGSVKGDKHLNYRISPLESLSMAQYRSIFYRPDIVMAKLKGQSIEEPDFYRNGDNHPDQRAMDKYIGLLPPEVDITYPNKKGKNKP